MTVMRVYARKVIDAHIDLYGLSLGFGDRPAQWARRRADLTKHDRRPATPVRDVLGTPLSVMACVWRMPAWRMAHDVANRVGRSVMQVVLKDREVLPVKRYMADADALMVFLGMPGGRGWEAQLASSKRELLTCFSGSVGWLKREVVNKYKDHYQPRTEDVRREVMLAVSPVEFSLPLAVGEGVAGECTEWWRICFTVSGHAV
eukprot:jgi/Botrbrau1/12045/Bobra.0295s0001.1